MHFANILYGNQMGWQTLNLNIGMQMEMQSVVLKRIIIVLPVGSSYFLFKD